MAPKAKAGVRGAMRRPGAGPRAGPALRRPAPMAKAGARVGAGAKAGARPVRRRPAAPPPGGGWARGEDVAAKDVALEDLQGHPMVVVTEGRYFGAVVSVAGRVNKVELEGTEKHIEVGLTGTNSEDILRVHGLNPRENFLGHLCPEGCAHHEAGDRYIHVVRLRRVADLTKEPEWTTNLQGAVGPEVMHDELHGLRERATGLAPRDPGAEKKPEKVPSSSGDEGRSKRKKRKKSKKRSKEEEKKEKSKKRAKSEDKEKLDGRHPMAASQKTIRSLFAGTGMDPKERVRRRINRKAKRYLSKKSKKDASSSSTSSRSEESDSVSEEDLVDGLFMEGTKVRAISERFPGTLCYHALSVMQENLLTEVGEDPASSKAMPISLLYYRQQLQKKAMGATSRELLTICSCLDHLVRGRPSQCADILAQSV